MSAFTYGGADRPGSDERAARHTVTDARGDLGEVPRNISESMAREKHAAVSDAERGNEPRLSLANQQRLVRFMQRRDAERKATLIR